MRSRNNRTTSNGYRGPVRLPTGDGLDLRVTRANLTIDINASSTAGGILAGYINSDGCTGSPDWAGFAAVYTEFRVLGYTVQWRPYYNNTYSSSLAHGVGAIRVLHGGGGATQGSLGAITASDTYKLMHSGQPVVIDSRARGYEELQWQNVGSYSPTMTVEYYVSGLTASTSYGRFIVTYLVEFKGRA